MPANATRQIQENSGSDGSVSDSQRKVTQGQTSEQHSTGIQTSEKKATETQTATSSSNDSSTTKQDTATHSASERNQTTRGESAQSADSEDVSTTERPQVMRRTLTQGGGATRIADEDFAMNVAFELEVTGPLSKCSAT